MKNKILTKQSWRIVKDGDKHEKIKHIHIDFEYHEYDADVSITIKDGENQIVIFGEAAKHFKKIMEDTKFIFKQ